MGFLVAKPGLPVMETDTHKPKLITAIMTIKMPKRVSPKMVLGSGPAVPASRALSRPILFIVFSLKSIGHSNLLFLKGALGR